MTIGALEKAADSGNYIAQRELGKAFYLGTEGLPRDYDKAFAYLLKASAQEDPTAESYLARLYDEGNGAVKDPAKAFFFYQKAANQGENESRCRVGKMYMEGRVIKADPAEGFAYLIHAASDNYPPGQLAVANCYAKGYFVHVDPVLAYKWALLASVSLPEARQALPDFRKNLTQAQIGAGQLAAQNWIRRPEFGAPQEALNIAFDDNGSRTKVDFVYANGNICIPVKIQNRESVYMIVDSGAGQTIVDADVAPNLGLSANDYNAVGAFGDDTAMGADVGGVRIHMKGMTLSGARVTLSSLTTMAEGFTETHPFGDAPLGGILGSDILSRFAVHIDYVNSTIEFILPNDFQIDRSSDVLPLTFRGQIPLVQATVCNGPIRSGTGNFVVDTGNSGAVIISQLFTHENPTLDLKTALFSGLYGLGGPSPAAVGKCSGFMIGNYTVPKPLFYLAQPRGDTWSAGSIGNDVWQRFEITIDYPDSKFYLKKYSDTALAQPFTCNLYGLLIRKLGDVPPRYGISKIWGMSAALKAGLVVGDEVTAVDGVAIANISERQVQGMLDQQGILRLSILHNGVTCTCILQSATLPDVPASP